jgi:hypothetical protein
MDTKSIFLCCKNNKIESDEALGDSKSQVCISAKRCNRNSHISPNSAVCVVAKFTSIMSIKITSLGKQHSVNVSMRMRKTERRKWHF